MLTHIRTTFSIAKASFITITRSPTAIIFNVLFPLIFILVFGFVSSRKVELRVALSGNSDLRNPILTELQKNEAIKIYQGDTPSMLQQFKRGRIQGILTILKSGTTSATYTLEVKYSSLKPSENELLSALLAKIVAKVNHPLAEKNDVAILKEEKVELRSYQAIDFILPGQLGFSLLSSGLFGTAFAFIGLRISLVVKRFFATPIHRSSILLGEGLSRLVFALIGSMFTIIIGRFFFGFTLLHGWLTFIQMMVVCTLGLIVFMGVGFIISGIAKTEHSVPPLANIVAMPQFVLSGTFFPIDVLPSWMQPFCKILPLTQVNEALRNIAFEGMNLWEVSTQMACLCAWGVAVYIVAVRVFRWE